MKWQVSDTLACVSNMIIKEAVEIWWIIQKEIKCIL